MPQPEPPFNTTRIIKVLEPAAGQYVVIVRVDPGVASRFPNKPFGTAITEVGLAKRETAAYPDYTLVSVEPAEDNGKDQFWTFQKLGGPVWSTTSKSKDNLTPAKFRGQTVVVKTEQEVAPATLPTTLAGDLVASVVARTPNTGKAVLTETTETIEENVAALAGQRFAPDGTLLATTEVLVSDGALADKNLNVAQSTVEPIGNGKSVKQTSTAKKRNTSNETVDGWPKKQKKSKGVENLTPQKYRGQTVTSVTREQVELAAADVDNIPDPDTPVAPQTTIEHEKVNDYRYEKRIITEVIDENANPLVGYKLDRDGQIATVVETLIDTGGEQDVVVGSATTPESSTDPIGNGKSVKTVVTVPVLLSKHQYSADNNPLIAPEKFRINPEETSVTYTAAGSASQPVLTGTYSSKSEKQIDKFTKQISYSQVTSNATGTVKGTTVDPRTGEVFADDQELVPASSVTTGSDVDSNGNVVLFEGLNANWSVKVTKRVASTAYKTWEDIVNYEWPPVLLGIVFKVWQARSGESAIYPVARYREGFQGPQKATVTQYWTKVSPGVVPAPTMVPEGFQYQCPLYNIRVSPCLHTAQTLYCNIGSSDPDWESATDAETFPATNYTDWPSSVFWRESKPHNGGFIITEYTINRPT